MSVRGGGVAEAATRVAGAVRRRESRGLEEERRYTWLRDHLARLDGKEARDEYYAWLDR